MDRPQREPLDAVATTTYQKITAISPPVCLRYYDPLSLSFGRRMKFVARARALYREIPGR